MRQIHLINNGRMHPLIPLEPNLIFIHKIQYKNRNLVPKRIRRVTIPLYTHPEKYSHYKSFTHLYEHLRRRLRPDGHDHASPDLKLAHEVLRYRLCSGSDVYGIIWPLFCPALPAIPSLLDGGKE